MVMKKDEKKGKIGFVAAQSSRNPILGKTGSEMDAEESEFSDVQTGHWKPETGHKENKIAPQFGLRGQIVPISLRSKPKTQDHKKKLGSDCPRRASGNSPNFP